MEKFETTFYLYLQVINSRGVGSIEGLGGGGGAPDCKSTFV